MKNRPFELSIGGVDDATTHTVTPAHQQSFKVTLTNHLPEAKIAGQVFPLMSAGCPLWPVERSASRLLGCGSRRR